MATSEGFPPDVVARAMATSKGFHPEVARMFQEHGAPGLVDLDAIHDPVTLAIRASWCAASLSRHLREREDRYSRELVAVRDRAERSALLQLDELDRLVRRLREVVG